MVSVFTTVKCVSLEKECIAVTVLKLGNGLKIGTVTPRPKKLLHSILVTVPYCANLKEEALTPIINSIA